MQLFSSAGDCCDINYSLPAVKTLGGDVMRLFPGHSPPAA